MPSSTWWEFTATVALFCVPPLWAGALLWVCPSASSEYERALSILVTPCFFLHMAWIAYVAFHISPSPVSGLPQRLRTVSYMKVFVRDYLSISRGPPVASSAPFGEMHPSCLCSEALGSPADMPCSICTAGSSATTASLCSSATTLATPRGARKREAPSRCQHRHCSASSMSDDGAQQRRDPPQSDDLPWTVVRRFSGAVVLLWIAGACVHVSHVCASPGPNQSKVGIVLDTEVVNAQWPEPASFFEVGSLHCTSKAVTLASKFASYTALWLSQSSLGPLSEAGDVSFASVLCNSSTCMAIWRAGDADQWQWTQLVEPVGLGVPAERLPLPADWRLLTAAWVSCVHALCHAICCVGWDGSQIVVGTLSRGSPVEAWSFRRRFVVQPRSSSGEDGDEAVHYRDVVALQLLPGARRLIVVSRTGVLDAWNLSDGRRLGQWSVGGSCTAVCQYDQRLVLARSGAYGPSLEIAHLPKAIQAEGAA